MRALYKCVAQKVTPVPVSDGSIPDTGLDWRERAIAKALPVPGPWEKRFIPKFSHSVRVGMLTPETLQELRIGIVLWPKKKEALLGMVLNGEYPMSWTWEELGPISDEVEPLHSFWLLDSHKIWKHRVFRIPMKVIPVEKDMIEERVRQSLFEPACGPYRNAHFLVPKKNGKYCFSYSAMRTNQHTLEDASIPPNVKEFSEAVARLPISSLIDFYSGYDQKILHKDSWDYMAFQTTQGMNRPTGLVQGATNSVSAFVKVSRKIPNDCLGSIVEVFVQNARVKGPMSSYREEVVEGLPGVGRFVMDHLQNLNNVLGDEEKAGATNSGEKSNWRRIGGKVVGYVCGEAGRWLQVSKVNKVWNWPWCESRMECRAFSGLRTYYQI